MNQYWKEKLEPYIKLAPFVGIGIVVCAIAVTGIVFKQRGAHVELIGSILKVRTLALDENSSAAIVDFRFRNPSDYPFVVRTVEVTMTDPGGKVNDSSSIAEVDASNLFAYFPALGQKFNPSLTLRTRIKGGESMDRMLAVRFEVPEKVLQQRKSLRIHVVELDGPEADFVRARSSLCGAGARVEARLRRRQERPRVPYGLGGISSIGTCPAPG